MGLKGLSLLGSYIFLSISAGLVLGSGICSPKVSEGEQALLGERMVRSEFRFGLISNLADPRVPRMHNVASRLDLPTANHPVCSLCSEFGRDPISEAGVLHLPPMAAGGPGARVAEPKPALDPDLPVAWAGPATLGFEGKGWQLVRVLVSETPG